MKQVDLPDMNHQVLSKAMLPEDDIIWIELVIETP